MASRREDVDLEIVLKNPKAARQWIKDFLRRQTHPFEFISLNRGLDVERTIYFSTMTDDEAIEVAWHLVENFDIRQAIYDLSIAHDLNEVH